MLKRARKAYTLLEVVSASTLFVFVMTLLAGTVSTVLSSRVAMRTAQDLDDTLSVIVDQVSSNDFVALLANTFNPPDICPGDPTDSGTLARSCIQISGQAVVVSYSVTPGPDSASLYGSPSDSADNLTLQVTATRPDGSSASRRKVVAAPSPGFKDGYGLLRVSMTGDYASLDTPLLLLGGPLQDVVVSAALPDGSATALLRADLDYCSVSEPCLLSLSDGSDSMPYGISGSNIEQIVLDAARVTDTNIRVSSRAAIVLTVDATNQTSKRHVQTDSPPAQGSVCVWFSFYDAGSQSVSACNTAGSGRSISLSSYTKSGSSLPSPLPTGVPITIYADAPDSDTCVTPDGMQVFNGSTWVSPSVPVCASWTWGQPSRVLWPDSTTSLPATFTLTAGQPLTGVLQYDSSDNPSSLPAGGSGNQSVFNAPRLASLCPVFDGACLPPWLNDPQALSIEASCVGSVFCYSGQSAPSIGYISDGASFAQTRSASLATVSPSGSTVSFRTHLQDNNSGSISVTVTSLPAGVLSYCNPGCTTISSTPFTLPYSQPASPTANSSEYIQWQFAPSGASRTTLALSLSDGTLTKSQRVTILPASTSGTAVTSLPLSQVVTQGEVATVYSLVYDLTGDPASTWSQDVTGTPGSVAETIVSSSTGWTANAIDSPLAQSGPYTLGWSLSDATSILTLVQKAHTVTNGVSTFSLSQDSTVSPSGSVTVVDPSGVPVENYPIFFKILRRGESYVGAYMTVPACLTNASGSCTLPDVSASYSADSGSGKIVAHTPSSQDDVSFSVTPKPKSVSAGAATITQGSQSVVAVTVFDGHGESMPDVSVTVVQGATPALSFSPASGITDATGSLDVTVSAASSRGTQRVEVIMDDTVRAFFTVEVIPAPAQVSLSSASVAATLGSQEVSSLTVTVADADGLPVEGASVVTSCASSTVIPSTPVPTGPDGTAEVLFGLSRSAAAGSVACSVTSGSSAPVVVSVDVS